MAPLKRPMTISHKRKWGVSFLLVFTPGFVEGSGSFSTVLDKNLAAMGPGILFSTGAGVWRKAPGRFPDSGSVLDKFQPANEGQIAHLGPISPMFDIVLRCVVILMKNDYYRGEKHQKDK